ncbi:MAG: hypothetical protein RIR62_1355 [Pseudomonadota bacterium]|jgi:hypothetical protein
MVVAPVAGRSAEPAARRAAFPCIREGAHFGRRIARHAPAAQDQQEGTTP